VSPIRTRLEGVLRTVREDGVLRAFLKHTGWLTASSASIIALSAVQSILTFRMLGLSVWGQLAIALGFAEVVGRLLSFRMNEFVVKWVTHLRTEDPAKASTAFKYALAGDVGSAVTAFLIVELLAQWGATAFAKNPDFVLVFRLAALTVLLQAGQQTLIGILQVNRDFRVQSLIQTGAQAASVVGMGAVYLAGGGLRGVVAVFIGAAALNALMMWTLGLRAAHGVLQTGWVGRKLVRFDGLGREMMRFAILGNLRGTLQSIMNDGDLLILGYLRNPTDVAFYKLAKSIAQIASLPNMPLVGAAYPEFATAAAKQSWGEFRTLMRRGSKVAALWLLPVSLGLIVFARPALSLLYGPSAVSAAPLVAILLVGIVVDGTLFWASAGLLALGEPGYVAGVALWATVGKLGLAFLLVPLGGAAALAALQSTALIGINAASTWRIMVSLRLRESSAHA
jgi:O-antigen/teichoic acid export membrane protein